MTTSDAPSFHLFDEAWVPVRSQKGVHAMIRPAQITSGAAEDDPWARFDSPRADLDAAFAQFFIGLIQTVMPPADTKQWLRTLRKPPGERALDEVFEPLRAAFSLDGSGPRFMQEYVGEGETFEGGEVPITDLFVNAPGDNTRKKNADFFVKRTDEAMSPHAAAIALFALQLNAYGGGPGYRTSIRGGGPLTTLHVGQTLWDTIYANVVTTEIVDARPDDPSELHKVFSWLAPTRTSHKKSKTEETHPRDVHPLQAYWAMPWRVRLGHPQRREGAPCVVYTRDEIPACYQSFLKTNYGTNYVGAWQHPLTPYRTPTKKGRREFISLKGSPNSVRYTSWPDLALIEATQTDEQHTREREIARNLSQMSFARRQYKRSGGRSGRAAVQAVDLWL